LARVDGHPVQANLIAGLFERLQLPKPLVAMAQGDIEHQIVLALDGARLDALGQPG
jgi:hypothetical protein